MYKNMDMFYRYQELAEEDGIDALVNRSPISTRKASKPRGLMPLVSALKIPHWGNDSPEIFSLEC